MSFFVDYDGFRESKLPMAIAEELQRAVRKFIIGSNSSSPLAKCTIDRLNFLPGTTDNDDVVELKIVHIGEPLPLFGSTKTNEMLLFEAVGFQLFGHSSLKNVPTAAGPISPIVSVISDFLAKPDALHDRLGILTHASILLRKSSNTSKMTTVRLKENDSRFSSADVQFEIHAKLEVPCDIEVTAEFAMNLMVPKFISLPICLRIKKIMIKTCFLVAYVADSIYISVKKTFESFAFTIDVDIVADIGDPNEHGKL